MPRCINHNDKETIFFCVNCERYICDECKEVFESKNFCKECYVQPILAYYRSKLPPPKPYYRPIDIGCSELIIRGILVLLGIFVILIGLLGLLICLVREYEVDLKRVIILFIFGFILIILGIIKTKILKKIY